MSILAAAGAENLRDPLLLALAFLLAGAAAGVGLFRPGRVNLPERLPPHGSAWPLVMAVGLGLLIWVMVPTVYLEFRAGRGGAATRPAAATQPAVAPAPPASRPGVDVEALPPADRAFLMTVPHIVVFLGLALFDRLAFGGPLWRLGLALRQMPRGALLGLLGTLAAVPLTFGVAQAAEAVYRAVGYQHPAEHDLLRVLGGARSPLIAATLVLGATVAAPLSEELLFRGHLQTLLRRLFAWLGGNFHPHLHPPDPADPVVVTTTAQSPTPPASWATWAGIVVAAGMFTVVHVPWTWPPIFVLAVCLGYAYERTGNLWVPITMHAGFNAASTLIYLLIGPGEG